MEPIYRINDVLHGCKTVEYIFKTANSMKNKGLNFQAFIYLVGCYASQTNDNVLRYYWKRLRKLFNVGFTVGSLYDFKQTYNGACCRIRTLLGNYVWYNTLSFEI